jgi:hypothetical protein
MRFIDDTGSPPRNRGELSSRPMRGAFPRLLALLVAAALAGCGEGAGTLLIDPGRYSAYHCKDIAAQWKVLVAREKELHDLMARADQGGGGGAIIGSLAYRTDYESVRSEERLLQREAVAKNCNATTQSTSQFQSDQAIR